MRSPTPVSPIPILYRGGSGSFPRKEIHPQAREAAIKALELDDTLAEAHNALATVKRDYDWDWSGAEREYKRAIELSPNYANAHQWYGELLMALQKKQESSAEINRAQELDPLSPVINVEKGTTFLYAEGRADLALEQLQKARALDPNFPQLHWALGLLHLWKGEVAGATAEFQTAVTLSPGITMYKGGLGHAYARAGQTSEARRLLRELSDLSTEVRVRNRFCFHLHRPGRKGPCVRISGKSLPAARSQAYHLA